jgi:hypothetical protein
MKENTKYIDTPPHSLKIQMWIQKQKQRKKELWYIPQLVALRG